MKDLYQYFKEQLGNLSLIWNISQYHRKGEELGNVFGRVWDFIDPIVRLGIYYFVFVIIFKRKVAGGIPTGPWMFIGLGNWFFYSSAISLGARSVQAQLALFSQTKVPLSVLPTIEMFKKFDTLFGMIFIGGIIAISDGFRPSLYYLQIPYYLFALLMVTLAFSMLFSTIVVVFRDFIHIIDYVVRFALYISGAAIDLRIIDAFPLVFRQALRLNPFIYCMEGFRDAVFSREWFWQEPGSTIVFWCFTLGLLIVAAHLHMKLRNQFMDYV